MAGKLKKKISVSVERAARGGLPGCSTPNRNLKNTRFVYLAISKVLRNLRFSINQLLKSADDWYFRILKSGLTKFSD